MANQTLDNILFFSNGYGTVCAQDSNHQIVIRGDRNGTALDSINYYEYGGTLSSGNGHRFNTGGVIGSQTLKFQISDNGNYMACPLGIGTSSPAFRLHVSSTTTNDGLLVENSLRNITCFKSAGEHAFMYIDSAHQCIYQPSIFFLRAGTLYSELRLQRASSSDPLGNYTESEGLIGSTGNTPFSIQSCGTRRISLTSAGNVLINRLSVSGGGGRLEVEQNPGETGLVINNTSCTTNYPSIYLRDAGGAGYGVLSSNLALSFQAGGSERVRVTSAGDVGVGTCSPSTKFTVDSVSNSTNAAGFFASSLTSTNFMYVKWGKNLSAVNNSAELGFKYIADGCNTNMATIGFYGNGGQFNVLASGAVGVGTCSPSYKLHVNGTFYAAGSSQDYKEAICKYDTDSCMFMKLKPVTYQYKDEFKHLGKELKSQTQIGLIAEEVAEVAPELAILVKENDNDVVRNVDYEKLSVILLAEVQKLRKEVDDLKNK